MTESCYTTNLMADSTYIYGVHPLEEALTYKPEAIAEVLFAHNLQNDSLRDRTKNAGIRIKHFGAQHPPGGIDRAAAHQGVVMRVRADMLTTTFDEFTQNIDITENTSLALLGELQDPHNVGAVIRNAAAFGIDGVLIPEHNQAQITPAVVKVSAGMAFQVPLVKIGNVNMTIDKLKDAGFWVYGLGPGGDTSLPEEKFPNPTVIVLGNEAAGIREKTREHCDKMLSIPICENVDSLNAAAATAVSFYAFRQAKE